MKNKAFHGSYKAQDGDIRVETFPADRKRNIPSMDTVCRRVSGRWEHLDGGACSEKKPDKYINGLKLAGTRGSTRYYRALASR